MPKKLAVGARKAAMKGKRSASKRELIQAGEDKIAAASVSPRRQKGARKLPSR